MSFGKMQWLLPVFLGIDHQLENAAIKQLEFDRVFDRKLLFPVVGDELVFRFPNLFL
jgi:hypothetical protein